MSEVFKTAQSSEVVATPQEIGPVQPEAKEISSENQSTPQDIERLDLFEAERGHKYAEDYFGFRDLIAGDWKLKMDVLRVDKYIKETLQKKDYDYTTTLYKNALSEMESEIGSRVLTPQKRLQKIINYIGIMQKIDQAQERKKSFFNPE